MEDALGLEDSTKNREKQTVMLKYLSFPLADAMYGVPIEEVIEVLRIQPITQVPHMPGHTRGIVNLRGKVIPVMDLRMRFGLQERDYNNRTCIVVCKYKENPMGMIVDTVAGVIPIASDQIGPAPDSASSSRARFIAGMGKTKSVVYVLLDLNTLFAPDK